VVANLLSNGLKFTASGGKITVGLRTLSGFCELSVEDSGQGIAFEEHTNIFEPFKQTKVGLRQGSGGTGLGLPIAKSLVEAHGGRLWLQSEPGKGATFYVSLLACLIQAKASVTQVLVFKFRAEHASFKRRCGGSCTTASSTADRTGIAARDLCDVPLV